jgi:chemotaxis protein CheX
VTQAADSLTDANLECVHRAVRGIFEAILGETPVYNPVHPVEAELTCDGVLGVISLVGEVEWSLVIALSVTTAPALVERFAGFPVEFSSPDMGDAVGELANLLAGEVKVELDRIGIASALSLPQVFRGMGIEMLRIPHVPCRAMLFELTCGPLLVAIATRH